MTTLPTALPFHDTDLELLDIEEVGAQLRAPNAFVRLCIETGCPTRRGKLSAAELLHWLFDHYPRVREASGLTRLAEVDGIAPQAAHRLKMANALFTLADFSHSRSSCERQKRHYRSLSRTVEAALRLP